MNKETLSFELIDKDKPEIVILYGKLMKRHEVMYREILKNMNHLAKRLKTIIL